MDDPSSPLNDLRPVPTNDNLLNSFKTLETVLFFSVCMLSFLIHVFFSKKEGKTGVNYVFCVTGPLCLLVKSITRVDVVTLSFSKVTYHSVD